MSTLRVAQAQIATGADLDDNLRQVEEQTGWAAATGARLVTFPEATMRAFGLPLAAEGVRVDETWDSVGMRGTGSHDLVLEDVFVSEVQVTARRTWGVLDRPLLVASMPGDLSVSVGAAVHWPGADPDALMGLADRRLYDTKRARPTEPTTVPVPTATEGMVLP